jgi:hypothetical protein
MTGGALSIGRYFTKMLDPSMNWEDVSEMVRTSNGRFCSKALCPLPMLGAPRRSAVLSSSSPFMAAGSWTAHGHHSTSWPKSDHLVPLPHQQTACVMLHQLTPIAWPIAPVQNA